jgi:hypothetical protein
MSGFALRSWQVSQDCFAQAHICCSGQQDNRGNSLVLLSAKTPKSLVLPVGGFGHLHAGDYGRTLLSQRKTRSGDLQVLIAAQRSQGEIDAFCTVAKQSSPC